MGANVQPNGNCELDSPAITLAGGASLRVGFPMVDGSRIVRLQYSTTPFVQDSTVTWPDATVESGETYDVTFWVRNEAETNGGNLRVRIDRGGGLFETVANLDLADYPEGGGYVKTEVSFVANGTTAKFRCVTLASGNPIQTQFWNLDAVRMVKREAAMAIKLAERGVAAVISLLQSQLATELTAIDTERADSITMDAPANAQYYAYPKAEIAGATAHVEVYEQEFEFVNPYTDADASRAVYELPVIIRLTHYNRANYSAADMVTRSRRYMAALFIVLNQTPLIDASDDTIQIGRTDQVTPVWVTEGEDTEKIVKSLVTIIATLRCEESYT